ncbi:metal ABC transporter solute-binding protein, Zn/Mn family [Botrimarina hoheduenensis]|uniref:Periplasmic zinc-binding protein TroA n=1 Tax=Botrimarina hoheduenensis TaxID=2528000 RepID=A0A5C5VQG6_9BACT|nr:zinc ABC transporter substrate-binding protein [Botrimarina hoheduenensis]TWT40834.1 Periplasmic zinc-binding protein TroA precursor [Botrimarina hoheduenensis]
MSRPLSHLYAVLALVPLFVLPGCGEDAKTTKAATASEGSSRPQPLLAIATTGMVADLVRAVGGDLVIVEALMGAGVDPHLYKPTRDDLQAIVAADIVFYSGLLLEGRMTDTLVKVSRNKPVYAVTELIDTESLLEPPDAEGHADPHVWMDVTAWSGCVEAVCVALCEKLPAHKTSLRSRAEAYTQELLELDRYAREALATIPAERRQLVTSHDAFRYFGRAYNLQVLGVQGLSTESEAGLQRINALVDRLVEAGIPAVFIESSVSPKNIRALIDGAGARGLKVRIGGELFSDAMGPSDTYEGTYIGMIDHNVTTVTRALGGIAPPLGMRGQLAEGEVSW